jgi:nicotinamidase-related amidase
MEAWQMDEIKDLLTPQNCALVLIDHQAGLAFAVQSMDRQVLLNNTVALAKAAGVFGLPIIASASASKVYSGPLLPAVQAAAPKIVAIERRNMNVWEDDTVREAIKGTGRKKLLFSGLLTEACVSFPVLSCLGAGYEAYVVADACGGVTRESHDLALNRLAHRGAQMTSWLQVLLELQRDWTRRETYAGATDIIKQNGGGYGIGLNYAHEMLTPKPSAA